MTAQKGALVGFRCACMPRTNAPGYELDDCWSKKCVRENCADGRSVMLKCFVG